MTVRPILFSAPMVRALLAGRKTQTRRTLYSCSHLRADQPAPRTAAIDQRYPPPIAKNIGELWSLADWHKCVKGDRLWVKETWRTSSAHDGLKPSIIPPGDTVEYVADGPWQRVNGKTRVAIFMPRWASRLTLNVTDVRVERLQKISEEDSIAEGVERGLHPITGGDEGWKDYSIIHGGPHMGKAHPHAIAPWKSAKLSYQSLWETLNGPDAWSDNPWVVAISFEVSQANVDA